MPCGLLGKEGGASHCSGKAGQCSRTWREPGWQVLLALPSAGRQEESVERGLGLAQVGGYQEVGLGGIHTDFFDPVQSLLFKQEK